MNPIKLFATPLVIGGCLFLSTLMMSRPAVAQQSDKNKLQVFILAGQSNMQGQGAVNNLEHLIADPSTTEEFQHLRTSDGQWSQRKDVWVTCIGRDKTGPLSVGFGKNDNKIGPELGFGSVIGEAIEPPVLIIKTCWGGRSLIKDYLPPSSGGPGKAYTELVDGVRQVVGSIKEIYPDYDDRGYEIAGFVWFQGWNDMVDRSQRKIKYEAYTANLANLIRDLRSDLSAKTMPVVIGELGVGGPERRGDFQAAQAAVLNSPEFQGNVTFVKTSELYDMETHKLYEDDVWKGPDKEVFYRVGSDRPYHYLGSGKIYYRMGAAFGEGMLELLK